MSRLRALPVSVLLSCGPLFAQSSFVNWETPHVHPLALTPGGARLCAVNTADARLEVFDASGVGLEHLFDVPVGLAPVSVRARTDGEVWVVNHVSDSISVVDLATRRVRATLFTDDEPADVVFAGKPQRAFVSCSQANTVLVFDPASLGAPPLRVPIAGEDPRALAVSADGAEVYVAVFESGNGTTILGGGSTMGGGFPPNVVNDPSGPWGGQNPPPNSGSSFSPPQDPLNPPPPAVGLVVRKDAGGLWMDDNGGDWTSLVSGASAGLSGRPVGWDLPDHDVAVIDAQTLGVSWATRLMNACMALAVNPATGEVTVVGTEATNEIRYEPNLRGTFVRVHLARVDPAGPAALAVVDLNPHLDYSSATVPQATRDRSLGDPRGIAWNAAGTRAWVTGMGSNNVVVIDATGARAGATDTIEVGEGPTGVVLHEAAGRAYVLNKFEAAVSVLDVVAEVEVARVAFHDPSPPGIRLGRRHLYDTHATSGLGQASCASCHLDARMDRLAWDLGDPQGTMKSTAGQNLAGGGAFPAWHPMKGPMTTQTLQDIIGKEPHHWRGDRDGIEEFNGAFQSLLGDDAQLTAGEMQEFEDFLATIHFPPNPFRNLDNSLPTSLPLPGHYTTGRFGPAGQPLADGDAQRGLALYRPPNLLDGVACVTCHTNPTGLGTDHDANTFPFVPFPVGPNGEHHHALVNVDGSTNVSIKIPHLRNLYDKVGFEVNEVANRAGFGFLHDGSVDSIAQFVAEPVFAMTSDQDVADMVAFMLAYSGSDLPAGSPTSLLEPPGTASQDAHAAVGQQATLVDLGTAPTALLDRIALFRALADAGAVGLVARGPVAGQGRGAVYLGAGTWQLDRLAETATHAELLARAAPGAEVTWTVVPLGTETRIGVDRDEDGFLDRDEIDACSDPADAASVPGAPGLPTCFGVSCPCGNDDPEAGCANSTGFGGRLCAAGTASLAADDLQVLAFQLPPFNQGLYYMGDTPAPAAFFDGIQCALGTTFRFLGSIQSTGADGTMTLGPGIAAAAGGLIASGSSWTFQAWHRDVPGSPCGSGANLTHGLAVSFVP